MTKERPRTLGPVNRRKFPLAAGAALVGAAFLLKSSEARREIDVRHLLERKAPRTKKLVYPGTAELSVLDEDRNRQESALPADGIILPAFVEAAATQPANHAERKAIKIFEHESIAKINDAREAMDPPRRRLDRISLLDLAGGPPAYHFTTHPTIPLGHAVPYFGLINTPPWLLVDSLHARWPITPSLLGKIKMEEHHVAGAAVRTVLACLLLGLPNYAKRGGIGETTVRGSNLTPQITVDTLHDSPPHWEALMDKDLCHIGAVAVRESNNNLATISFVLGKGLNTEVPWPRSCRGCANQLFAPLIMKMLETSK
jgi:hypothetical protein